MRRIVVSMISLAMLFALAGCTKEKQESKNMEQIYREEGVPVRTAKVVPVPFKSMVTFNSVLMGIKESSAGAAFDGKVEKIFVSVGDYVKKDQVLVTFPTDSPAAKYFQARIGYENARTAFQRIEGLYKSGGISLQARDNAKAALDVAKADWDTVRQLIKVKAPISGCVSKIYVTETENVKEKSPLVTISNTEKMKAAIWVSEDEIFHIKQDMPAVAVWKDNRAEGKVVQVDMAMDMRKRAFRAVVEFDNPENLLKAGTTVEVQITTYENPGAFVVKRQNLIKEGDSNYVFLVKSGKAVKQQVVPGKQQVLDVEITQGLNHGDELVVEGAMLLEDGNKVKTIETR